MELRSDGAAVLWIKTHRIKLNILRVHSASFFCFFGNMDFSVFPEYSVFQEYQEEYLAKVALLVGAR